MNATTITIENMSQSKIVSVKITKLWNIKDISTMFHPDVNVFIGVNGSSKTTFLNLIEGALLVDIRILSKIQYERISIVLDNEEIKTVDIDKDTSDNIPVIRYRINNIETYEIPYGEMRHPYRMNVLREIIDVLRNKLCAYVPISWLSVYRERNISKEIFDDTNSSRDNTNVVDAKLNYLLRKLLSYRLQLEGELNKVADKFKEDVFSIMLYNKKYDCIDVDNFVSFSSLDPKLIKRQLFEVFKKLGIVRDKAKDIADHMDALASVMGKILSKTQLSAEDLMPIALLNRTMSLIDLSKKEEAAKSQINAPLNNYLKCLKDFMPEKTFEFEDGIEGMSIKLDGDHKAGGIRPITITPSSLSSGEKQLLILLTETLLQQNVPTIFLADEPELSLHIDWQRKIISSVRELNPNAQIIVATHSPEIAGLWIPNVINMANITNYVQ